MKGNIRNIFSILLVFVLIVASGVYSYGNDDEIPEEPTEPIEQTEIEEPTDPETPNEPEEPQDPEMPENPQDPEVPVDPTIPVEPEQPVEPLKATLIINHILKTENEEEIINTGIVEDLEVGTTVYGINYVLDEEKLIFLSSDPEELTLTEEENVINLYYQLMIDENEYIPEAPDFPPGEGKLIDPPYIEEFSMGSLGPFEKPEIREFRNLGKMQSTYYPDEKNNKIWPEPGSLDISKTGLSVQGTGNQWEITLEIKGKNIKKETDIVLVIDRSRSMEGIKMENAKTAAKAFVNKLLVDEDNDNIRIAVVSFSDGVSIDSVFQGYSGRQTLIDAIDGIQAGGGTYTQAGIKQGNALLAGSKADYKNMVLLSDGAATYSYGIYNPYAYLEFWGYDSYGNLYYRTTSSVPKNQFKYGNKPVGDGTSEYTIYNLFYDEDKYIFYCYRHGASAVAEAGFGKSEGYEIYSIAFSAGSEGEWTLQNVASLEKYYPTSDSASLEPIFLEIAGRISYAATDAVVIDPIEEMYSIPGINSSNYNSLIKVSHGTISYNTSTDTISWDIGTISEENTYWMKYTVALDYRAEGGTFYPANKPTYIEYKNIDGEDAKKYFEIPKFRLRALNFTKIIEDSNPIDKEFDIILEGPVGPYSKVWTVCLKPGEPKAIKGLLPGEYTVKEIVPMNFKLMNMNGGDINHISGNEYKLIIDEYDWDISVVITNKRDNDGWFWDDPEPTINSFKVGASNGSPCTSIPTNKTLFGKITDFILPEDLKDNFELDNA